MGEYDGDVKEREDLFVLISVELLTVQSCLLKEILGDNCTVVRREGEDPYFLLLFKRFERLATFPAFIQTST